MRQLFGMFEEGVLRVCRTDNAWHHIALTWSADSGETRFYWDGQEQTPFWAARQGKVRHAVGGHWHCCWLTKYSR